MICPCCNLEVESLVHHHWIEEDGTYHRKDVCKRCNRLLSSTNFGMKINHVLPPWSIQIAYVQNRITSLSGAAYLNDVQSMSEQRSSERSETVKQSHALVVFLESEIKQTSTILDDMRKQLDQLRECVHKLED